MTELLEHELFREVRTEVQACGFAPPPQDLLEVVESSNSEKLRCSKWIRMARV